MTNASKASKVRRAIALVRVAMRAQVSRKSQKLNLRMEIDSVDDC